MKRTAHEIDTQFFDALALTLEVALFRWGAVAVLCFSVVGGMAAATVGFIVGGRSDLVAFTFSLFVIGSFVFIVALVSRPLAHPGISDLTRIENVSLSARVALVSGLIHSGIGYFYAVALTLISDRFRSFFHLDVLVCTLIGILIGVAGTAEYLRRASNTNTGTRNKGNDIEDKTPGT